MGLLSKACQVKIICMLFIVLLTTPTSLASNTDIDSQRDEEYAYETLNSSEF